MRILVLANFGMGLYKFRKELLLELINRGHDIHISLPFDDYVPLLEDLGCKYIKTNVDRRGKNPFKDLKLLYYYVKMIKKIKPDMVLTYTIKPNIYGGIACRLTKTEYLANITGLGTTIENKGLLKKLTLFLYKEGLRKASCIFFQNKQNMDFFIKNRITSSRAILIPGSGVNLEENKFKEYPIDDGTLKFLFIGRIMKAKGIDELIESVRVIKEIYFNIEFHIVGFCEEEYSKKLCELNEKGLIKFHGQQKDVQSFIKNIHAVVLPSYHEGLSNALLEVAATGRPVIASNISGCKETFNEGISGFGFEVKNTQELVKAIVKFIELPYENKKDMGIAGRMKMEKEFDRKIIIDEYIKQINLLKEL